MEMKMSHNAYNVVQSLMQAQMSECLRDPLSTASPVRSIHDNVLKHTTVTAACELYAFSRSDNRLVESLQPSFTRPRLQPPVPIFGDQKVSEFKPRFLALEHVVPLLSGKCLLMSQFTR